MRMIDIIRDLLGLPEKTKLEELVQKRIQFELIGLYDKAVKVIKEISNYLQSEQGKKDWFEFSKGFNFFKGNGTEIIFVDDLGEVKE